MLTKPLHDNSPISIPDVNPRKPIRWWEPYRYTCKISLEELRKAGVLKVACWLRIIGISWLVLGLLIAWIIYAYPLVNLPWVPLISCAIYAPIVMGALMAIQAFAPRSIEVRPKWIQSTHGQHALRIPRERIRSASIIESDSRAILHIDYTRRNGKAAVLDLAIAEKIDLLALNDLLQNLAEGQIV